MRFLSFIVVTGLVVANAAADGGLMKVRGLVRYTYNYRTGELQREQVQNTRALSVVWDMSTTTGYFFPTDTDELVGDWGDMDPAAGDVTKFSIGYATTSTQAGGAMGPITVDVVFYDRDNGRGDSDVRINREFRISGLPAIEPNDTVPPNTGMAFVIDVVGFAPFDMHGSWDEDFLGFAGTGNTDPGGANYDPVWHGCVDDAVNGFGGYLDFGYTYRFHVPGNGLIGPLLQQPGMPGVPPCPAPGEVDMFDLYGGPAIPVDPNAIVHKPAIGDTPGWSFLGAVSLSGPDPFSGLFMSLSSCAGTGCDEAEINGDCLVDLSDLAIQLSNFGTAGGATKGQGDLNGDGNVDLSDLALMLSAFGTDCN